MPSAGDRSFEYVFERAGVAVVFEPIFQPHRVVLRPRPFRDRPSGCILLSIIEEWPKPALVCLWKVQIRKTSELRLGVVHRRPAIAVNEKEGRRETGAILPTGTFDQERPRRTFEGIEQTGEHFTAGQISRIQHDVEMFDAAPLTNALFIAPPAKLRIGAAQVDQAFNAVSRQERTEQSCIGLRGARRFARHDPVEIIQNIAGSAHSVCVPVRATIRNQP